MRFRKKEIEYSPWENEEWNNLFAEAEIRLSKERMYMLSQLLEYSMRNSDGDVIEMGVYRGCTAYVLGYFIDKVGKKNRTLFLCDTFSGTPEVCSRMDGDIDRKGKYKDTSAEYVMNKLGRCCVKVECIEGFIPDSLSQIPLQARFCFAHIHLNLYESTKNALLWLSGHMEDDGLVIIEDYGIRDCKGVKKAVDEFKEKGNIDLVYLTTGQAVVKFI